MTYLGLSPDTELSRRFSVRFNGNDSATSFVLPQTNISDPKDLDVYINNVHQDPFISYSVTVGNSSINFSEAPQTGTNNILVVMRDKQKFASVGIDDKSVTSSKLATSSVGTDALVDLSVTSAKLASGAAAGNLGANTISALQLQDDSVLQNTIKNQSVTTSKLDTTLAITNTTITTLNTAITNVVVFNANHVSLGETGQSATINLSQGTYFSANQTDNCTWSITNPPTTDKATGFILELTSGGGNTRDTYTTTWPNAIKWPQNTAPTLTRGENAVDVIVFVTESGNTANYRAVVSMANSGGLGVE